MIKILIVDDEKPICDLIDINLSAAGYQCKSVQDGLAAIDLIERESFDLILLDIMLPGADGFDIMEYIRPLKVPVIFITARGEVKNKIKGLKLGAEDYLVKPFSYMELLSRVKALIRRYRVYQRSEEEKGKVVFYRDLTINQELQTVQVHGKDIALTEMEYQILLLLVSNPRKVFSVKEIYETIWKEIFFPNSGNTVMVHIRNIRRKLEKNGESYIQNIWGRGYCVN